MPGIVALRDLISLDCTTSLVDAGYLAPWLLAASASSASVTALTITGASNTTPIVITTSVDHGIQDANPSHVVISGVGGNTAANNLDADDNVDRAWVAARVSSTSFALYSVDDSTGALVESIGSGVYTSGGTVQKAFVDGRILLGRQHSYEQSSPPRVVFIPRKGNFEAKDVYNRSQVSTFPSPEARRQIAQSSIRTEQVLLEVHAWGAATPPNPDEDFDATQVLYQQVIRSAQRLAPGTYDLESGDWADQAEGSSQLVKEGHLFVFGLMVGTPVLRKARALVPKPIVPLAVTNFLPPDGGSSEVGCTDIAP